MNLDIGTLETVSTMAHEGVQLAADRYTTITGVQTRVRNTRLVVGEAVLTDADWAPIGVSVELDGTMGGRTLIGFNEPAVTALHSCLRTHDIADRTPRLQRSVLTETGFILINGFVDGWADALDTEIDVSPPTVTTDCVGTDTPSAGDRAPVRLSFWSQIDVVDQPAVLTHCFVPTAQTIEQLVGTDDRDRSIEASALGGAETLLSAGVSSLTETLSSMTDTTVESPSARMEFVALDRIPERVAPDRFVSVAFSFSETPSGYLVFLFTHDSASQLAATMTGTTPEDDLGELTRDAIQELANVMASSLLDGWANVLETAIDHSVPAYTDDMGPAVIDPLVVGLSDRQAFAFVLTVQCVQSDGPVDLQVYTIPDEADLLDALQALDTDRIDEITRTPEFTPGAAAPSSFAVAELTDGDSP